MSPKKSPETVLVHRVLIVEDDDSARAILEQLVRSRGDSPRAVATVEEAMRALGEETFCYVLLDQQLPSTLGEAPMLGGGERIMVTLRKRDSRRTEGGFHVTPVIVLTGYSSDSDFVSKMYDLGASAFIAKPLTPNLEKLLDRIRTCLARGGRGEHERCVELSVAATGGEVKTDGAVTLAMGAELGNARTGLRICGELRWLQDSKYVVLLRLVVVHRRGKASWESREALGMGDNRALTNALRKPFEGLLPEGFEVLESDRRGQFRLNPKIVVEHVDWVALSAHPDVRVRNVALKARGDDTRA